MGLSFSRDFNLPLEMFSDTPFTNNWNTESLDKSLISRLVYTSETKKARADDPYILMNLITDLHLKVLALIYKKPKSKTLCSRDQGSQVYYPMSLASATPPERQARNIMNQEQTILTSPNPNTSSLKLPLSHST